MHVQEPGGGTSARIRSSCLSFGEKKERRREHDYGRSQPRAGLTNKPRGQSGPRFRSARFVASGTGLAGEWGGLTEAECRRLKR